MNKKLTAKDPIDQILDENNTDTIVLYDDEHKPIEFEQVALIPLDSNDKLYAILIPTTPMQNVEEGEGVLFEVDEDAREITVVNDEKIIDEVLTVYEKLIGEDNGENNK